MTKHKHQRRKPNRIVRTPATRLAHLQKRRTKGPSRPLPRIKK